MSRARTQVPAARRAVAVPHGLARKKAVGKIVIVDAAFVPAPDGVIDMTPMENLSFANPEFLLARLNGPDIF